MDKSGRWPLVHNWVGPGTETLVTYLALTSGPPPMLSMTRRYRFGAKATIRLCGWSFTPSCGHDLVKFLSHPFVVLRDDTNERIDKSVTTRDRVAFPVSVLRMRAAVQESGWNVQCCYLQWTSKAVTSPFGGLFGVVASAARPLFPGRGSVGCRRVTSRRRPFAKQPRSG